MATEERDLTDLGICIVDDDLMERAAAARRARVAHERETAEAMRAPAASPAAIAAAKAAARRACGWSRPSQAAALEQPCERCSARPATWCRRSRYGRAVPGLVHPSRGVPS